MQPDRNSRASRLAHNLRGGTALVGVKLALAIGALPLAAVTPAVAQTWNAQVSGGHWEENVYWTPASHPNGVGAVATFNHTTAGTYNVGLDVNIGGFNYAAGTFTVGELNIISNQATGGFNFSGHGFGGHLVFEDGDGTADINVHQASPLVFAGDITITLNSDTNLNVVREFQSDAPIGGAGSLTKTGGGTATLAGNNTYTGATIVVAGTLNIQNASGLGSIVAGTTVQSGATLALQGGIVVGAEALSLAGMGDGSGGALRNISGNNSYGGAVALAANSRINSDSGFLTLSNTVDNNGFDLTLGGAGNGAVSGVISGGGDLVKDGAGTWTLSAVNTYSGETRVTAGTLALSGAGSIADSSEVSVSAGAIFSIAGVTSTASIATLSGAGSVSLGTHTLVVTDGSTTFSGTISGSGGVTVTGGTQTFSGTNLYTGTTTVDGGTLNNTNLITGLVTLDSGAFDNSGTVNGGASVNAGTYTNSGTTSGGVTVNGGTFASTGYVTGGISHFGGTIEAEGSISGSVASSGGTFTVTDSLTLDSTFQTDATLTVNGAFTGLTSLTQTGGVINGTGSVTTAGAFVQTDGTTGGTVVIDAATFSQSGGATIAAGTTVTSAGAQTLSGGTIAGDLDGLGAVTVQTGTTTVTGRITGASSITVAGTGTLLVNGGGSALSDLVTVEGTLTTGGGALSASAAVSVDGTFNLQGDETIGSLAGAGSVAASGGSVTLSVGSDGTSFLFAGGLSNGTGTLSLTKTGLGMLTLSGLNTFTGATTIDEGIVEVAPGGSIAGSTSTVNAGGLVVNGVAGDVKVLGGFLAGGGTVGSTTVGGGGTLAPGNSIGTITVRDNLTFAAGSTYEVEVSPTDADRTNVVAGLVGPGDADLSGAKVVTIYAPGDYVRKEHTILSADGGLGGTEFAGLESANVPNGMEQSLRYDANNVYLVVDVIYSPLLGLTGNQNAVASAINGFFDANGGIPGAFVGLLPGQINQLTGEVATGAMGAGMDATGQFLSLIGDPGAGAGAGGGGGDPLEYIGQAAARADVARWSRPLSSLKALAALSGEAEDAAAKAAETLALTSAHGASTGTSPWHLWGAAYGGGERVKGNATVGSAELSARIWGIASGVTRNFGGGRIGIALGGAGTSFSLAGGLGSGSATSFNAGLHGTGYFGDGYVSAALAYGYHATRTSRAVPGDILSARFGAQTFGGRLEAGYRLNLGGVSLTPYGALEATAYRLPGYTERSALGGPFALTYGAQTETAVRTELGARSSFDLGGNAKLTTRAAWVWNADAARSVTAAFQALPGASFTINGAQPARHAALVEAGVEAGFGNVTAKLTATGEFSRNVTSFGANAKVGMKW